MSAPAFCDACKARVEWHVTAAGKSMPLDPEPSADGNFVFGRGLRLERIVSMSTVAPSKKRYRCHWDTCPKGNAASKRVLKAESERVDQCERWACFRDPDDGHRHCFKCGEVDHFAGSPECPEAAS